MIHQCKVRIAQGKSRIEELTQAMQRWDKDIESLHKRIALVNQSVQMGNLQDPMAAQRQIAQFQDRVDEIETLYLGFLDEQEQLGFTRGD